MVTKARPTRKPILTIGMPTWKEPSGVFYTVQSLIASPLKADILGGAVEILVVDNAPHSDESAFLREYLRKVPFVRYVELMGFNCAALAKEQVVKQARGDVVVCIDGHVLFDYDETLHPVYRALRFLSHPENHDVLLHGPYIAFDLGVAATHMVPGFAPNGMFGQWRIDERGRDPEGPAFEIEYMGTGAFACRKDRWVGMNPRFRGVCAEEGYLHDKWRKHGGRVMCLPGFRWIHRPILPDGNQYPFDRRQLLRNYLLQYAELGKDPKHVIEFFSRTIGEDKVLETIDAMRTVPALLTAR